MSKYIFENNCDEFSYSVEVELTDAEFAAVRKVVEALNKGFWEFYEGASHLNVYDENKDMILSAFDKDWK
ncbi:MAG: hypothetical protein MJA82_02105 [Clostridia bacterium]|nr:hypothetical protein [Clostridia bacterium]